jgi:hypothetical protein
MNASGIYAMTFDDVFGRLVRLSGYGLGVYAVLAGKLSGSETVALVLAFVGFEVVVRASGGKPKLNGDDS